MITGTIIRKMKKSIGWILEYGGIITGKKGQSLPSSSCSHYGLRDVYAFDRGSLFHMLALQTSDGLLYFTF